MTLDADATRRCVAYTLARLLDDVDLGGRPAERLVRYGDDGDDDGGDDACVVIVPSGFFSPDRYGRPGSVPELPLETIEGVPLLFGRPRVERRGRRLVTEADIIAGAYFLLTRYEEIVRRDVRDVFGRFPGRESLPARAGFIDRPVVDEYADILRKWLGEVGIDLPAPARRFRVALTHDVDCARKYAHRFRDPPYLLLQALRGRRPVGEALRSLGMLVGRRDPFDTFGRLLALDASAGDDAEGTWFFMVDGRRPRGQPYHDLFHPAAVNALRRVRDRGVAVGLHVGFAAGEKPEFIGDEKTALEEAAGGEITRTRFHCLAWREVEVGRHLAAAGITDDYTLGSADVAGFRLGVCRPVPVFDPVGLRPIDVVAHPLALMDCTLSHPTYMALDEPAAIDLAGRLVDHTRNHRGELVTLWHNHLLAPGKGNYHPRLYRRLLETLSG